MNIENENNMSTQSMENQSKDIYKESYGIPKVRLYREIKWSLARTKNELVDQVMKEESNIDDILEAIAGIIDAYEKNRMIFKHYIFEGNIPEEFFENGDVEEGEPEGDDDIEETDNMGNTI